MSDGGVQLVVYEAPNESPMLEDCVQYLASVKATLSFEDYRSFLGTIGTFREQGDYDWLKVNVKDLLEGFIFLTRGLNVFLPKPHRIVLPPAKSVADLPTACRFLHKIKRCLTGTDQILDSFLHILQNNGDNRKSVMEIYCEVAFLLRNDKDLLKEFTQFLHDVLKPTANVSTSSEWKNLIELMSLAVEETKEFPESVWSTELLMICNKVKQQVSAQDYSKFLHYLKKYNKQRLSSYDLEYLVENLLVDKPALVEEFKDCVTCLTERSIPRGKRGRNGQYIREGASSNNKLVENINLERCFRCTPSYRLVPETYMNPEASKKSQPEKQVLNNRLVSVASKSCRSAPVKRNPYADRLFKCEDEMSEIDMLINNASSVISCVKRLLKKISDPQSNIKIPIRLDEHFKAMNFSCITQVYGDEGSAVLEAAKHHPHRSLPVLLDRMKKQRQKWIKEREDHLPIWNKIMHENHHKSLDPQGFTKKENSKTSNGNALIPTVSKEINNKSTREVTELKFPVRKNRSCIKCEPSGRKSMKGGQKEFLHQIEQNEKLRSKN